MDTSAIDPRMMSWEDIKAVLATAALQMQESRQQMQAFIEEADRRSQEADRRSKDADRRSQEAEKRSQETFRKLRELADQFTSTIGHISEGLMAPAAKRIFKQAGFDLNHYYRNLHSKDKNGHAEMEVDLLMLNGSIVIAVEIKTDCRKKDVDHFFLTSSLGHPKIFVKEFFNGFVPFHDHCPGEKLAVEWQTDLYGRHCLSHSQYLVNA